MAVSVRVDGLKELLAAFKELPKDLLEREMQKATDAGIAPILVTTKGNAARVGEGMATHNSTGLLARSVVRVRGKKLPSNRASFVAIKRLRKSQIRSFTKATGLKARQNRDDPFYWKFWEFGTSKLPARSFIRNAWDLRKEDALKAVTAELGLGLKRSVKRVARSGRVRLEKSSRGRTP